MKTTIEIADDLFGKIRKLAERRRTTIRSLTERGLRLVLKQEQEQKKTEPALVAFGGDGLREEFADWDWSKLRQEVYRGRTT
jgi:predicted transcriptional regulator